jgi:hypothetical protein
MPLRRQKRKEEPEGGPRQPGKEGLIEKERK